MHVALKLIVCLLVACAIIGIIYGKKTKEEILPMAYQRKVEREPFTGKKVLVIGNSFGDDSVQYISNILMSIGIKNVLISNMFIGGCSLERHYNNLIEDKPDYEYRKFYNGEYSNRENMPFSYVLSDEDWDLIIFQQQSILAGQWSSYSPYLAEMIKILKEKFPEARFGFNMTWALKDKGKWGDYETYNNDQMTMYNAIVKTVSSRIETLPNIDFIIPSGTAIQNARVKLGDTLNRDDGHLNERGRYLVSLTWAKELFDIGLNKVDYYADALEENDFNVFCESVENAYKHPYAVTSEND